jgi:hypothetical protein
MSRRRKWKRVWQARPRARTFCTRVVWFGQPELRQTKMPRNYLEFERQLAGTEHERVIINRYSSISLWKSTERISCPLPMTT